ncbi:hypothetical protein Dsin_006582 [Dipteronia sinensis]|uniref:Uncharacterized protein n=1 Tax=Dipteronia sinensis TaxID=43782 RepID=A0AAE0EHL5_9ROSI|nr:hypothetical protein Dsin_006582 [Dipteronia sinensis]
MVVSSEESKKGQEIGVSMSWSINKNDCGWISKCTVEIPQTSWSTVSLNSAQDLDRIDFLTRNEACKFSFYGSDSNDIDWEAEKDWVLAYYKVKKGSRNFLKECSEIREQIGGPVIRNQSDFNGGLGSGLYCICSSGKEDRVVGLDPDSVEVGYDSPSYIKSWKSASGVVKGSNNTQSGKRGLGSDIIKAAMSHGMNTRSSKHFLSWILEDQIIKIIDMGTTLGFDFYDKEVRMADVIAKAMSRVNGARLKMVKEK